MPELWGKEDEIKFFLKSFEFYRPEQIFYKTNDQRFLAYWPTGYKGEKSVLQSRNSLIGSYTEKWVTDLLSNVALKVGGYSIQGVICDRIGLTNQSPADVAICKTYEINQKPENILLIIEVKMSIVWNWEYVPETGEILCVGDYKTHQGNPSLLRSDTVLKAIGKSINIRVSSFEASHIPIIVIGNTPITKYYWEKVDHLKSSGIIQGFWSVNPFPLANNVGLIKTTPKGGFYRFDSYTELENSTIDLIKSDQEFFSGMQPKVQLGQFIELADQEMTYEGKAVKFLRLLRGIDQ